MPKPLKITKIPPKRKEWQKYHLNLKMTKIPLKPFFFKKPKYPLNIKMTKIPPKPKKCPKYPQNLKID